MEGAREPTQLVSTSTWYLDPDGWSYELVRLVRASSLLYGYFFYPFEYSVVIASHALDSHQLDSGEFIALYVVDGLYLLTTVLEVFFLAYTDSKGALVTEPKQIFRKFLSNYIHVLYRLLMLLPIYLLASGVLLMRCVSLFEISKVKYFIGKFFRKVDFSEQVFGCIRSGMKASILESFLTNLFADILTLACIIHLFSSLWISVNGYKMATSKNILDSNIQAIYFLFTTAGTIGYGDVTVDNKATHLVFWRYLFATLVIFFALIFFSYLQSLINALRSRLTFAQLKLQEDVAIADSGQ